MRNKQTPWNKGKKMSKEFCEKVSIATRLAMQDPEIKRKCGNSMRGKIPWNKGKSGLVIWTEKEKKKHSEQAKQLGIGKWMKGKKPAFLEQGKHNHRSGENHHNWKGGISLQVYKIRNSKKYTEWRKEVYKRDNWICQYCGKKCKKDIIAHHINVFSEFPDLRFDINNGITLCRSCHLKMHKGLICLTLPILIV